MDCYLSPAGFGLAEYIEKKSRFIGHVWHVECEEEAQARINEVRARHAEATHNVYAYILREGNTARYSDDGEPGGTSGKPTLGVFSAGGVTDVCCVVTRYFGGTLLGSGGLVRAYSTTARKALEAAGIAEYRPWRMGVLSCGYAHFERLKRLLAACGARLEGSGFGETVTMELSVPAGQSAALDRALTEATAGTVTVRYAGECWRPEPGNGEIHNDA